ncbi:MAG: hypothetical protein ACXAEU_08265 [Candidatus Hodarchaeales archaeon]|jgi:hypothetical protein
MKRNETSLLVMLKFNDQDDKINPMIGDGNILWKGINGFELIGKGKEEWDEVFVIRYKNANMYQEAIDRFKGATFKDMKLISVKPLSWVKIKAIQFLMRFILSKIPLNLSSDDDVNVEELLDNLNSPILPTGKQLSRLLREDKGYSIEMLNFLKYTEIVSYPADYKGKKDSSGEVAYNRYGKRAMRVVAKLGGCIIHMGKVNSVIIGDIEEDWDSYAVMRYPLRKTFEKMFTLKGVSNDGTIHRDAGLKKTKLIALDPEQ